MKLLYPNSQIGAALSGTVATYSALPAASSYTGMFFRVTTASGTIFIDRRAAGVYVSDGSTWIYVADFTEHDQASEIDNDSAVTGATVKDALETLNTAVYTDEKAQDAVGAMVDASLVYVDATPLLTRAALTGDVTASQGSNTTTVVSASATVAGKVELATLSEINTGTDTVRAIVPDDLAGSYAGTKSVSIYAIEAATTVTTGDGKSYMRVPAALNGMNLVTAAAAVNTKSTSGLPTVQIARGRQSSATSAHTYADMLSTKVTIDANEFDSKDGATAAVIDGANDDVLTGDLIRVDVDVAGTGTAGLIVNLEFRLP